MLYKLQRILTERLSILFQISLTILSLQNDLIATIPVGEVILISVI